MKRPRVLVTSIFAPSDRNRSWYALQRRFLSLSSETVDIDYRVYLNGVSSGDLGENLIIAGFSPHNAGHSAALRELLHLFRASDHEYFLILDSDCFPVHRDWFRILTTQMARFGKRFAAPIRTENLDWFPHPCAFFIDALSVDDSRINFAEVAAPNLIGTVVNDVGNAMLDLLPDLFPLVRTNVRNRHPIAAAIYHHLFYHHGAGSRSFRFRSIAASDYYAHWWDTRGDLECANTLSRELFDDPEKFLNQLLYI